MLTQKGEQPRRPGRGDAKQPYYAGNRGDNPTANYTGYTQIK